MMWLTRLLLAGSCFWLPPTPAQEAAQEHGSAPSTGSPACQCVDPWAGAAPLAGPCRNATLGTQQWLWDIGAAHGVASAEPTEQLVPSGQTTHWSTLVITASEAFLCVPPGHGSAAAAPAAQ